MGLEDVPEVGRGVLQVLEGAEEPFHRTVNLSNNSKQPLNCLLQLYNNKRKIARTLSFTINRALLMVSLDFLVAVRKGVDVGVVEE